MKAPHPEVGPQYNRLLAHIWSSGQRPAGPPTAKPIPVKPPKPPAIPPKTRVAMLPKPKPGEAFKPDKPIDERIRLAVDLEWKRKAIVAADEKIEAAKAARNAANQAIADFIKAHPDLRLTSGDPLAQQLLALEKSFALAVDEVSIAQAKLRTRIDRVLSMPKADRARWKETNDQGDWSKGPAVAARKLAREWIHAKVARTDGQSPPYGDHEISLIWNHAPKSRGWANSGNKRLEVPSEGNAALTVHEMGHHVEFRIDGVFKAAKEFLEYRVKGQALKKLNELFPGSGYKDDEFGRDDEFGKAFGAGTTASWYVGKHYDGATEIVSMGLEKLYTDPVEFARKDPEYCKFIIGILDGSLRTPWTSQPLQPVTVTKK
jgi:hypothetical protein